MKKIVLVKDSYETEKVVVNTTAELNKVCSNKPHLCFKCANADAKHCSKIAGVFPNKKRINDEKYSFIEKGYQVLSEDGRLQKFIVSGCDNYREHLNKTYTIVEKRELTAALMKFYYGVETIEEAASIRDYDDKINKKIKIKSR